MGARIKYRITFVHTESCSINAPREETPGFRLQRDSAVTIFAHKTICCMDSFEYSPLLSQENHIRLLRLLPDEDGDAPLRCHLCDYSLQRPGVQTHLYEALSYVWGDPLDTLPIYVNERQFSITVNLHAALSRLRDSSFERILWIDAICINQKKPEEQGRQVQLMSRIYSLAIRVIVWLGEETSDVKGALENIRLAAVDEDAAESWKGAANQKVILTLLQRSWFQRIWVLQEVAAARHVVVICGSIMIDGYAFCLGVKSFLDSQVSSYSDFPELQGLLSLIGLIEQSGLRSKHIPSSSDSFSLKIRPLTELFDMFHTRRATDVRDKVYALLGMSLGDLENATLKPDYTISWGGLFQTIISSIFGKNIVMETDSQKATFKSKGCILGQVSSVQRTGDRQTLHIRPSKPADDSKDERVWTIHASAKPIQERDIVCLLEGRSKPTIIRLHQNHFAIIMVAVPPLIESIDVAWPETSQLPKEFQRDLLLVWDWGISEEELQASKTFDYVAETFDHTLTLTSTEPRSYLEEAIDSWNNIMILDSMKEYKKADARISQATASSRAGLDRAGLAKPVESCGRTLLSMVAGEGHEDIVMLLLNKVDPDLKDVRFGLTPLACAARNGHSVVVEMLLATGQVDINSRDWHGQTPLSWAAQNGHSTVVEVLLAGQADTELRDAQKQTPLSKAAQYGWDDVVKLLLETGRVEIDSKDEDNHTPLCLASRNGHQAVVALLLATAQVEIDYTAGLDTPLALASNRGHEAVVALLLASGGVDPERRDKGYGHTPLLKACRQGHEGVVRALLTIGKVDPDLADKFYTRTPLSWACAGGHSAVVTLLLATGRVNVNSRDNNGHTPLLYASQEGHHAVVALLLATGQADVNMKDSKKGRTPFSWAVHREHCSVVKLLLDTGHVDPNLNAKSDMLPLSSASKNGCDDIVEVLLASGKIDLDSKKYKNGQTPLMLAAEEGHEAVVKLLLANEKIDVDLENKHGIGTPLLYAARYENANIVKLLLATGRVDVNFRDRKYVKTPLIWATQNGDKETAELLIANPLVDVNLSDGKLGQTPLMWAVEYEKKDIVKLLLAAGTVNINLRSQSGESPISVAAKKGDSSIIAMLRDYTERVGQKRDRI